MLFGVENTATVLNHENTTSVIGDEITTARATPTTITYHSTVTPTAGNYVIEYKTKPAFSLTYL